MPHKSEAFLFQQNATLKNIDICIFKYATHISYVALHVKKSITFPIKRISKTKFI